MNQSLTQIQNHMGKLEAWNLKHADGKYSIPHIIIIHKIPEQNVQRW